MLNIKYMGSKSRIAKDIVPIIQKYIDNNKITSYIENKRISVAIPLDLDSR